MILQIRLKIIVSARPYPTFADYKPICPVFPKTSQVVQNSWKADKTTGEILPRYMINCPRKAKNGFPIIIHPLIKQKN